MFDLEKAIDDWRRQMLATGIGAPVPMEELELHLREEIERQLASGASHAGAFKTAADGLGHAQLVQMEFEKIETPKMKRREQMAKWLRQCVVFMSGAMIAFGIQMKTSPHWSEVSICGRGWTAFLVGIQHYHRGIDIYGRMLTTGSHGNFATKHFLIVPWLIVVSLPLVPWWLSNRVVRVTGLRCN